MIHNVFLRNRKKNRNQEASGWKAFGYARRANLFLVCHRLALFHLRILILGADTEQVGSG